MQYEQTVVHKIVAQEKHTYYALKQELQPANLVPIVLPLTMPPAHPGWDPPMLVWPSHRRPRRFAFGTYSHWAGVRGLVADHDPTSFRLLLQGRGGTLHC